MADTSCSKLFKPLPPYQLRIINELSIPIKNSTISEILKREKIYIKRMSEEREKIYSEKMSQTYINNDIIPTEFSHIKTFNEFKKFVLSKKGASSA